VNLRISGKEHVMPTITVEGPPLPLDKKRRLARGLWEVATGVYEEVPPGAIVVLIKENVAENVCVGGELLCDRRPEGAAQKGAAQKGGQAAT
jgi:4-oxalocrotonate tautomerase family enzyme